MFEVPEETKKIIDNMSEEDMIKEIEKGSSSKFQREKFFYLQARLKIIQGQKTDDNDKQTLTIANEANEIAKTSNNISQQSNLIAIEAKNISKTAVIFSGVALLISILIPIIQYYMTNLHTLK